jgi:uncharacterized protein YdiU (UPF0061 family)
MVLRYAPPLENIYVPKPCIIWELRHTLLSLMLSGDPVLRDVCITEIQRMKKVQLCRVAPSFICFRKLASQNDLVNLKLLTDFTIKHHFQLLQVKEPEISCVFAAVAESTKNDYRMATRRLCSWCNEYR